MKHFSSWFAEFRVNLNRDAALDSLRNVLMVIGLSSLLADFATMKLVYVIPCIIVFLVVCYVDYLRHDLTPQQASLFEQVWHAANKN